MPFAVMPRSKIFFAEFEEQYFGSDEFQEKIYREMAESQYAEQVIAASHFFLRKGEKERAVEILTDARERMKDGEGIGAIAAELLDVSDTLTEGLFAPVYLAKFAKKTADIDPQEANRLLYDVIFNRPEVLLEDRVILLRIYIEYIRQWGFEAGFQLEMELMHMTLNNKLVWHKEYFEQNYFRAKGAPEQRGKAWMDYQRNLSW
jgi:hypothetical protein